MVNLGRHTDTLQDNLAVHKVSDGSKPHRFATKLKEELFEPDFKRSYELTRPISVNGADYIMDSLLSY